MATQVRIRRRGRIRLLVVATFAAALCLVPAGAASAVTAQSTPADSSDNPALTIETDATFLAVAGLAALGFGTVVVKKAGL